MRRRDFLTLVGGSAAWPMAAQAQNAALPVVGFLHSRGPEDAAYIAAGFRRGLRDAGFIDGQNVRIEYRWAHGQYDQLSALAKELTSIPVSVLVAGGGEPAVLAAKLATSTIPIVFVMSGDAVKLGLAGSINRPGANVTGIDIFTTVLDPKRLSLLHDIVPDASTIGYLVNAGYPPAVQQISSAEAAASAMGARIQALRASNDQEIDAAFQALGKEKIHALVVASSPYFDTQRNRIVAARDSVPTIYHFREYAVAGGLISYGVDIVDAYRQMALYTSQILKGAKAGDLPILQAAKFDVAINLKAAKALGLTIPSGVLAIEKSSLQGAAVRPALRQHGPRENLDFGGASSRLRVRLVRAPTHDLVGGLFRSRRHTPPYLGHQLQGWGSHAHAHGGRLDFWSLENAIAGRSRRYHRIAIDEAAFAKDGDNKIDRSMMAIWEKSIKPTLYDYGGEALVCSNSAGKNPDNFFYNICTDPGNILENAGDPRARHTGANADKIVRIKRIEFRRHARPREDAF